MLTQTNTVTTAVYQNMLFLFLADSVTLVIIHIRTTTVHLSGFITTFLTFLTVSLYTLYDDV